MGTLKQIEAARRNGALSRGPVSAEGRARSAHNSLKHGLTSKKMFVLDNEKEDVFHHIIALVRADHAPETALEEEICMAIAHAHWRLRRLWVTECAMFDRQMDSGEPGLRDAFNRYDEGTRIADAFEHIAGENSALAMLTRYENRLYRTIERLEQRLSRLRRARRAAAGLGMAGENVFVKNEPDLPRGA